MDDSDGNEDELDVEDDGEDQQGVVDVPITLRPILDGPFWQVAKTPSYPNMSVEHLRTRFGAQDFISQLSVYLGSHSTFPPNLNDRFNAYHQVKVTLPPNRIRTTPAVARKDRRPASLGHFDVALVIVDRVKFRDGNGFDGRLFF